MSLQKMQEFKRCCYRDLNVHAQKGQTVFTGSSLMEGFPLNELCMTQGVPGIYYNRGISGLTTEGFLECIHDVLLDLQPRRIFINIGTNDIARSENWEISLEQNYRTILRQALEAIPGVSITLMAYYPVNESVLQKNPLPDGRVIPRTNAGVAVANRIAQQISEELSLCYIDVNHGLTDCSGQLRQELTVDGIHMYPAGYEIVFENLKPYL